MKYWRLCDGVNALATYGALAEGHEFPDELSVAVQSLRRKIESFVDNDVYKDAFPMEVKFVPVTPDNYHTFPVEADGTILDKVDYFATTVDKKIFIQWAIKKRIQVPDEFKKLICESEETSTDKTIKKRIKAAVSAGIFCASQGMEVKKEQLQEKLDMYGPTFEEIWKEVPPQYKQPGGRPKKVVEKIIDAAVFSAGYAKDVGQRLPKDKLHKKLEENHLDKIDPTYLQMIKTAIDTYITEE
jgi:hypothetical protein